MKRSVLLDYLFNRADALKDADKKKSISVDYFMIALLTLLREKEKQQIPEELSDTKVLAELDSVSSLLAVYGADYFSVLLNMKTYVTNPFTDYSMDGIVFRKFELAAEAKAQKAGKDCVEADLFTSLILAEPTVTIKQCLISPIDPMNQVPEEHEADDIYKLLATLHPDIEDDNEDTNVTEEPPMSGRERLSFSIENTRKIQTQLLENVIGQDQAVNTFVSGYFQAQLVSQIRKNYHKPQVTFLFAGPPGVGKTFMAGKAAEFLGLPYQRFDMSEYCDKEANLEFCGSDKVYKNGRPGNVTRFVQENPRCVLLFDEIEKAHLNVIHLFLQILDAGRIRDNYTDEEVSFTDTIIIFTTNVGRKLYDDPTIVNLSSLPKKKILKALSSEVNPLTNAPMFPAAICSRFASGNVVMFNHLNASNLLAIVNKELYRNIDGLRESTGIRIEADQRIPSAIMYAEGGKADARTVKGRTNAFFHDELYELFRLISSTSEDTSLNALESIDINISLNGCDDRVSALFDRAEDPHILIFAEPETVQECRSRLEHVTIHATDNIADAQEYLFSHDISIILCDIHCKASRSDEAPLNAEDIRSEGVSFLHYALEKYDIPLFLFQRTENELSQEEYLSFTMIGVQGIVTLQPRMNRTFEQQIIDKCTVAYQQTNMLELAKANKVLTYKTAQTINRDRTKASISLFDFELTLSTDTDDSKNILDSASKPNVRFDDVIGAEDAKEELRYFVDYLKNPKTFIRRGLKSPKGILLYGPPGTGKTLLAKAMAGESDVTFLTAEGNQFLKKFVGEGADAVHAIFASARKYAPAILFVDEIDAIGKNRSASDASDNGSGVLTAFLTEMDGFNTDTSKPVFVLAATNYDVEPGSARSLDPALLRRFDRRIYVDLPNQEERKRFLRMRIGKTSGVSLSDEQIDNIAMRSTGMSLAELESVFELAMRSAVRMKNTLVGDEAFDEAFETFLGGKAKKWEMDSLTRTARHESGHALLCWLGGEKPSYLTVVARGNHGGYMQHADTEDKGLFTRQELLRRIRTSLAGRAAEIVYYGTEEGISTGAAGDLQTATGIAEQMICRYGMDDDVGLAFIGPETMKSAKDVRDRVNAILKEQLTCAVEIISQNKSAIDALTEALLQKNHLKENEIDAILRRSVTKTD